MKHKKEIAKMAAATNIPIGIVGLNAAQAKTYRLTLVQPSLRGALQFDLNNLTEEDKKKTFQVVLMGKKEVWERLNNELVSRGLDQSYELVCPDEQLILNAHLARILPHTPSLSVMWAEGLKAPTATRTKDILVPVKAIQTKPGAEPAEIQNDAACPIAEQVVTEVGNR